MRPIMTDNDDNNFQKPSLCHHVSCSKRVRGDGQTDVKEKSTGPFQILGIGFITHVYIPNMS